MSHTLIFGFDEQLARWACERIPWASYSPNMRAVGVADGDGPDARLLAVCIYHNYIPIQQVGGKPWYGLCEVGFASATPRWATRSTIRSLMSIPFLQYDCRKVVAIVPSTNEPAIRLLEGIGAKQEGPLRHHFAKGVHACVFGMMRWEFEERWKVPRPTTRRPTGTQAHAVVRAATASP